MNLILGVDGGGTHTRVRLAKTQGEILGEGEAGSTNPHAQGMEAAQAELLKATASAFHRARIPMQKVAAACLGLSGADRPAERDAWNKFAGEHIAERVLVVNDGMIVLAAGTPENWGVALVAGTGSIAWGRTREGRIARAGGWGYVMGDEGSSYDLARSALRAAAQAADGRGPETRLLSALLEYWNCREPMELIQRVYRPGLVPADLAVLAPIVTRCAEQGDAVARQLVADSAQGLATAVRAVSAALDFREEIPLAITGGLILSATTLREAFVQALEHLPYRIHPITSVKEPVRGALRLAQELAHSV